MKNIINILIIGLLVLVSSCQTYFPVEPDLENVYPSYVELASTNPLLVPEGGNITVTLSSRTVIYQAYTVSYELTGDYTASGSVEIPSGYNSKAVSIPVDAGIVTDEPLSATLTLVGVSEGMELGRNGNNLSVDITITKFVPFSADDYATTFNCDEPGYKVYPIEFVKTADPLVLTNTNFWDSGFSIDYTFSGDFEQTVVIKSQTVMSGDTPITVEGSGTYDGVTKTIIVDYTIVDDEGNLWDDNTHTFTLPT